MDITPHWKRVWVTLNGRRNHIGSTAASSALGVVKNHLFNGINMYKPFTETGYTSCWEKMSHIDDITFRKLMRNVSLSLNLDTFTSFAMLCNYLKFECYVQVENVENIILSALKREKLVAEMWEFYTLERMFMLKLLSWIIGNYQNVNHPFYELYQTLIDGQTFKKIQTQLFDQYETLLKEMMTESFNCERNYREQLQVLFMILSTFVYEKCNFSNFLYLLKIFKENNCRKWHNTETDSDQIVYSLKAIQNVEIAIFLSSLYNLWDHYETWYDHYEEIEVNINLLYENWGSPIIPLAWVTLHLSVPQATVIANFEDNMQIHLGTALQFDVFTHLQEIVSDDLFKGTSTGIMVKASVFTILEVLCIKLGANKIFVHPGTLKLLGKLLKTPEIAAIWQQGSDEGTKSFYCSSLYCFPYYFNSLSTLAKSLIHLRVNAKEVISALNDLQLYTENYENAESDASEDQEVTILLTKPYRPLKNDLVVFPVGTKVTISKLFDDNVISFHGTYSYFSILVHIVNTLFDEIEAGSCTPMIEEAAITGCKVLHEILEIDHTLIKDNDYVKELSRLLYCLFCTISKSDVVNKKLMKLCFKLTICELNENMLTPLLHVKILPTLLKDAISSNVFANCNNLSVGYLTVEISKDVLCSSSCYLIELYVKLVMKCLKNHTTRLDIIIPGLMFLIVKLFPIFAKHLTSVNVTTARVCCKLIKLIQYVLGHDKILNDNDRVIYTCVVDLFIKKEPFIWDLSKICLIGGAQLEIILSAETNFKNGRILKIVKTVKRALTCYMYILKYVIMHHQNEDYIVFKTHLWKSCFNRTFLQTMRGYISHSYDNEIPQIVFEILGSIAFISKKPLLQLLECNSTEARQWIMQCFRDPLLDDNIKISIIHYITSCVHEQSGLIMAFFNISLENSECSTDDKEENMITCMIDYLKSVTQDEDPTVNPIQLSILELFHLLWKTNRQFILKKVNNHSIFWSVLTLPLFKVKSVSVYITLLTIEILVLELNIKKGHVNDNLKSAIDDIFKKSNNFIKLWIQRATEITKRTYVESERSTGFSLATVLLTVLKKFILIVRHFLPTHDVTSYDYHTEQQCLDSLLHCVMHLHDGKLVALSAELCLILYKPRQRTDEEITSSLDCMTKILVNFSYTYTNYESTTKTAILTLAAIILKDSKDLIYRTSTYAASFLSPFVRIFENEFFHVVMVKTEEGEPFYYNWVIILKIVNTILRMDLRVCDFFYNRGAYLKRLITVLELYTQNYMPIRVAEVVMASLFSYAKSPFINEFDFCCKEFKKNIQRHSICKLDEAKSSKGVIPENVKNNWKFYTHLMNLNCLLLKERGIFVIHEMLSFIQSHEGNIADGILTATLVATDDNLQLVCSILRFLFEVFKYLMILKNINRRWFFLIMMSVTEVLNMSCHVLLRPSILVSSSVSKSNVNFRPLSDDHLVSITNSYVDIVTWVCLCLNRWNPPLTNFFDVYQSKFEFFVEYDFRVPPPMTLHYHQLTYNNLFCTLHFICKVLMDISIRKIDSTTTEAPRSLSLASCIVIYPQRDVSNPLPALFGDGLPQSARLEDTWLMHLNTEKLSDALCALGTVLATQTFLSIKNTTIDCNTMYNIKWELCAELMVFYEFVNKYIFQRITRKLHGNNDVGMEIVSQAMVNIEPTLVVDLSEICCNRKSQQITIQSLDDCYLVLLTHWFRQVCRLSTPPRT